MIGSSASQFLGVVSRATGWLIAMLFRRRALISMANARDTISRTEFDTKGSPRRAAPDDWPG
jgi:hypothetical protein